MTVDRDATMDERPAGLDAGPGGRPTRSFETDRVEAAPSPGVSPELLRLPTGRVASLRFMKLALRRRRALWVTLAVAGLVLGAAYGAIGPKGYTATATVYLTHFPGTSSTVDAQDDLAMLDTVTVGRRALAVLGDHGLTPRQLLGPAPGELASDDVLVVTISGPTPEAAVARVDAVARVYLAFRAQQYGAQMHAIVAGARRQVTRLEAVLRRLTPQIAAAQATGNGPRLQSLDTQRAADTAQIGNLRQAIAQDGLQALAISKGSRVITPGTLVPSSRKLDTALDGLFGLLAGLAVGVGGVLAVAVLSDRLRRREEVAAVLGAPVLLSVPHRRRLLGRRGALPPAAASPVHVLAHHLDERLGRAPDEGGPPTELVVAIDDAGPPAEALALLCRSLNHAGRHVVVVDVTDSRALGRALGVVEGGLHLRDVGGRAPVTLFVPEAAWDPGAPDWESRRASLAEAADSVLVLATLDLGTGAAHLRPWSSQAIVTVGAGRATAQRIDGVVRLLAAAGVAVSSGVLLEADDVDESVGIPDEQATSLSALSPRVPAASAPS